MHVIKWGPMLELPKSAVEVETIKRDLKIPNGAYFKALQMGGVEPKSIPKYFNCYSETSSSISVPRHYEIPWKEEVDVQVQSSIEFPMVYKEFSSKFILRSHQPPAVEALGSPGDKILAMRCGAGKTVVTISAWATHRSGPLLVLVDTEELAKQWVEAAALVLGDSVKVGRIQGPREEWKGYSIAIGMVQTMWKRQYEPALYKYFEVIAYDEVHICGSSRFQEVLPKFYGERWGLSATPERADGNTRLIKLHMGEVAYEDLEQPLKPEVYFVQTKFRAPKWIGSRKFQYAKAMICSALAKKEERNQLILDYINKAASKGRSILILGDRIAQHQWLLSHCDFVSESGLLVAQRIEADGKKKSLTRDERDAALEQRLVFATMQLAKKGLDKPLLDTLILPFPVSDSNNIQQILGRIQREGTGKASPIAVVFEDDCPTLINGCDKMRQYCMSHGIKFHIVGTKNESPQKSGMSGYKSLVLQERFKKGWLKR